MIYKYSRLVGYDAMSIGKQLAFWRCAFIFRVLFWNLDKYHYTRLYLFVVAPVNRPNHEHSTTITTIRR